MISAHFCRQIFNKILLSTILAALYLFENGAFANSDACNTFFTRKALAAKLIITSPEGEVVFGDGFEGATTVASVDLAGIHLWKFVPSVRSLDENFAPLQLDSIFFRELGAESDLFALDSNASSIPRLRMGFIAGTDLFYAQVDPRHFDGSARSPYDRTLFPIILINGHNGRRLLPPVDSDIAENEFLEVIAFDQDAPTVTYGIRTRPRTGGRVLNTGRKIKQKLESFVPFLRKTKTAQDQIKVGTILTHFNLPELLDSQRIARVKAKSRNGRFLSIEVSHLNFEKSLVVEQFAVIELAPSKK